MRTIIALLAAAAFLGCSGDCTVTTRCTYYRSTDSKVEEAKITISGISRHDCECVVEGYETENEENAGSNDTCHTTAVWMAGGAM